MSFYVPETLRLLVSQRAKLACEYCLLHQDDAFHSFHIDHIISLKHGGQTAQENLAFACPFCNRNKGSDVGSYLFSKERFVRFYHPRNDRWNAHFYLERGGIYPKTEIGEATVKILHFNAPDFIVDRRLLIQAGRYPGIRFHD